jgi:hypothetical protein
MMLNVGVQSYSFTISIAPFFIMNIVCTHLNEELVSNVVGIGCKISCFCLL